MDTTRRGFFGLLAAGLALARRPKVAYVTDADVQRVKYPGGEWVYLTNGTYVYDHDARVWRSNGVNGVHRFELQGRLE